MGRRWRPHGGAVVVAVLGVACLATAVAADRGLSLAAAPPEGMGVVRNSTGRSRDGNSYHHVWPKMELGWRIVLGSLISFFGAAFGSVGGVGGGGIFVPMLALVIGFDPKSSVAMSKCMIMGASVSTVYYNLKLRHPTLDMPLIDYDLALLMQPMLMLGVSIGVIFNVIFPDWLVTAPVIILLLGSRQLRPFSGELRRGRKRLSSKGRLQKGGNKCVREQENSQEPEHATTIKTNPAAAADSKTPSDDRISVLKNVYWKEFGLLAFVWMAFLALQIAKNYMASCSALYWVLNSLQIPVSVGVTMYEADRLMTGKRVISSKGNQQTTLKLRQLFVYSLFGIIAGLIVGLLGLGGGFILGPLFLELGIHPQVSSATATFAMMFSSSMSVVEYYLLHRFPVPYAAYFTPVALIAAFVGQHCVSKLIDWLGRASLIIFILASMIFLSAICLGGVGISTIVHKLERHQYMGFEDLCMYGA
ncbi:hypothetical protein ACP70R_006542 [Stipagrostis hirtigluma subsp. patula]